MTDQPRPDEAIQAETPHGDVASTAIQESPTAPDVIPLPPLPGVPNAPEPVRLGWSFGERLVVVLLAILAFFLGSAAATNSDVWMHLATGRSLADGTLALGADPYSFPVGADGSGREWVNHSWLYDLALYGVYAALGEVAVVVCHALLLVVLLALALKVRPAGVSPLTTVSVVALMLLVVSVQVPANSVVVTYVLFAALFALMNGIGILGRENGAARPAAWALLGLPLLFVLWVNVDSWFILGVAVLLLGLAGAVVDGIMGHKGAGALKLQVLSVAASVAACCVNPYHVRAFVLPAELAYALGSWLPSWLGAGGEALRGLMEYSPDIRNRFLGPFHHSVLSSPTVVLIAYYILLLLSATSFVLVLIGPRGPDVPPVRTGRLLIWGGAVLLSVTQFILTPFFALVAGPVTILNLGDWARGRLSAPDDAGLISPGLARFCVGTLMLVALALAWPGWLHSSQFGAGSVRRVAWRLHADPSLQAAAKSLAQENAKRVFNMSVDVADYCAWFAPGVRCILDRRLDLFAKEASPYAKAKKELFDDALEPQKKAKERTWPALFRDSQIDHLVLTKLADVRRGLPDSRPYAVVIMCWSHQHRWTQRYCDGRTAVFSWSPTRQAAPRDLLAEWNQEAFGAAPEGRRAPLEGAELPQAGLSLQELYVEGRPLQPPPYTSEPFMHQAYFLMIAQRWQGPYFPAWQFGLAAGRAGMSGAAPGTVLATADSWAGTSPIFMMPRARDLGPPAAPILMIREARRTLHEPGSGILGLQTLMLAYKFQFRGLEDNWTSREGEPPPSGPRAKLRQVQLATLLHSYLELVPDDWQTRREYAQLLRRQHHLDAGLEQLKIAQQTFDKEKSLARDKKERDLNKAIEKDFADQLKVVERDLKRRLTEYNALTAKLDGRKKFAKAVLEPYRTVNADNRETMEVRGMGLTLEGLKELQAIPPEDFKDDERAGMHYIRFRLLAQLGRIHEASEELLSMGAGKQPPEAFLWHAAALGNYQLMQNALAKWDDLLQPAVETQRTKVVHAIGGLARWGFADQFPIAPRIAVFVWSNPAAMQALGDYDQLVRQRSDLRTLRGLFALEVGDVAQAEGHFAEALRGAGPSVDFIDRPIAERYLELIRAQRKQ